MSCLKLSAFADEYAASLDEQLSALRQFGIEYIEPRHINGKNISVMEMDEIVKAKSKMKSHGIKVSAIGSPIGKIRLDGDIEAHLAMAKKVFEFANVLETDYVRIFSFYAPENKQITDMKDEAFAVLEKLVVLARKYGLTLCHENEARIYGDIPSRCREIIDGFNGEIKCVFDMGNYVLEGVNPYPEAYELLKKDIAYFHIKDALKEGAIVPAGRGDARIKEILNAHKNYAAKDFFVSLEPHLQSFSGLNALVGRSFVNPYQYPDEKTAFADAVAKFKELM